MKLSSSKITEIFVLVDDFCKEFEQFTSKYIHLVIFPKENQK